MAVPLVSPAGIVTVKSLTAEKSEPALADSPDTTTSITASCSRAAASSVAVTVTVALAPSATGFGAVELSTVS